MPLNFSELYHKSDLINNNSQLFHVPGVYIWGFIYEKVGGKIANPVDFTRDTNPKVNPEKHLFIPYYVGQGIIMRRLMEHLDFRRNDSNKKTRIAIERIPSVLAKKDFPLNCNVKDHNKILKNTERFDKYTDNISNSGDISYFNDSKILAKIYNDEIILRPEKGNFPIQKQLIGCSGREKLDKLNTVNKSINFPYETRTQKIQQCL